MATAIDTNADDIGMNVNSVEICVKVHLFVQHGYINAVLIMRNEMFC